MSTDEKPQRVRQAEGLRALAAFIEKHAEFEAIFRFTFDTMNAYAREDDKQAQIAGIVRAALRSGARIEKDVNGDWFSADLYFGDSVKLSINAKRDEVCERIQVGEETVTKTVPDPAVEVPMVEVAETVPTYEWQCRPLLAAEQSSAATS